jgi:hypothetical protein
MDANKKPDLPLSIIGFGVVVMIMLVIGAIVGGALSFGASVIDHAFIAVMGCANELGCIHGTTPTLFGRFVINLFNLH